MKIVFIGTGDIGISALQSIASDSRYTLVGVVTQPDRPFGRHMELKPSAIKELALTMPHVKILQPEKIRLEPSISEIKALSPDLIVVAAYGQILPKSVLEIPPLGCINLHASLLPKYRGASPIQGAIRGREARSGMTIMWMDEGLDTGPILLQESITLGRRETGGTLHDRLGVLGGQALMKALPLIEAGTAPKIPQDNASATLTKKIKKEDGHLNWDQEQLEVDATIRAMNPWPSAYSWLGEGDDKKMLKIFSTIVSRGAKGAPGEVVQVDRHGILVAARLGGLLLREVQMEGKKRMHAAEFARGQHLAVGSILK